MHGRCISARSWHLGGDVVDEVNSYKNLAVTKCYTLSSTLAIEDSLTSARIKAYSILCDRNLNMNFTCPLIYLRLWPSICIPSLLYGCELWQLNLTQLNNLEAFQR